MIQPNDTPCAEPPLAPPGYVILGAARDTGSPTARERRRKAATRARFRRLVTGDTPDFRILR
ncbi:hypothetical protein [Nocardia sp. NPDC052566]|uniref:hypothetical protein n=1 Tax=Nocardia sp. NPDC052566 TaxID=3364330 RepID=UPI0037C799EF